MIFKQLELLSDDLEFQKERKRQSKTVAQSLIQEHQIPEDAPLNVILKIADSKSNEEALMKWILFLTPETEYLNTEMYAEISDNLRRTLNETKNNSVH